MATISSHTLNGLDGTHAGGIGVRLRALRTGETLFDTETDPGGRLQQDVDLSDCTPGDQFELVFATGIYWRKFPVAKDQSKIIAEIVLRFQMPDPDGKYHMPVILSPNSYSVWASG